MVRGNGLCRLIAEDETLKSQHGEENYAFPTHFKNNPQVLFVTTTDECYVDIAYYLTYGECPPHLDYKKKRTLKLKETKFVI